MKTITYGHKVAGVEIEPIPPYKYGEARREEMVEG